MSSTDIASERGEASSTGFVENSGSRKLGLIARCAYWAKQREFRLQLVLFVLMLFWYGFLLHLSPRLGDIKLDLTFNSMLDHLLHGQFDVDPEIVGGEGFLRNGHVYSYLGIWCALLRFPLWLFGRLNTDMTAWSCLAAVCLAAMAKVRTVLLLQRSGVEDQFAKHAVNMMLAYVLLGGSEIGYLRATIFQEVVFWAVAFAAIFVYCAIKGLIVERYDLGLLSAMALCAGLALLTRVSTGVGLILAFGLLLLVLVWQSDRQITGARGSMMRRMLRALRSQRILIPLGILGIFILATGAVNYFRWGNPLTFANLDLYIYRNKYPDRVLRDSIYGQFNFRRIPFALMYYSFPVWAVRTGNGTFLFESTQTRLFDGVEFPPSSFFLTDLLPLCFIAFLIATLWKRRSESLLPAGKWVAIAAGLSAPGILMLTYTYLSYRYRMEFYPEIDFLAFVGLYLLLTNDRLRTIYARHKIWIEGALIVSIATSLVMMIIYLLAPFGPARDWLHRGLVHGRYYVWF